MSSPPDTSADLDDLIWHFAGPLPADRRGEFYRAAQDALAGLRCVGPGSVHRTVAMLFREFFIPPPDEIRRDIPHQHRRPSKLVNAAPLA